MVSVRISRYGCAREVLIARKCGLFSALFFEMVGLGPKRSISVKRNGHLFAGFFHITEKETSMQLNKTATLQPRKKNHVILFMHGCA